MRLQRQRLRELARRLVDHVFLERDPITGLGEERRIFVMPQPVLALARQAVDPRMLALGPGEEVDLGDRLVRMLQMVGVVHQVHHPAAGRELGPQRLEELDHVARRDVLEHRARGHEVDRAVGELVHVERGEVGQRQVGARLDRAQPRLVGTGLAQERQRRGEADLVQMDVEVGHVDALGALQALQDGDGGEPAGADLQHGGAFDRAAGALQAPTHLRPGLDGAAQVVLVGLVAEQLALRASKALPERQSRQDRLPTYLESPVHLLPLCRLRRWRRILACPPARLTGRDPRAGWASAPQAGAASAAHDFVIFT